MLSYIVTKNLTIMTVQTIQELYDWAKLVGAEDKQIVILPSIGGDLSAAAVEDNKVVLYDENWNE